MNDSSESVKLETRKRKSEEATVEHGPPSSDPPIVRRAEHPAASTERSAPAPKPAPPTEWGGEPLARVILKPRKAMPFHFRHPWVFDGAVGRVEWDGEPVAEPGPVADLLTDQREWIGRGLLHPTANLKLRLLSWDEGVPLDRHFFATQVDRAVTLRERLEPFTESNGCRLVFSEADGLSGLTVDRYGRWLAVQFTGAATAARRDLLFDLLTDRVRVDGRPPAGIVLRTEKGVGAAEDLDLSDGPVRGDEPPRPLFLEEHGLRYGVDLTAGQKTGFYLDQRDNRLAAARHARGRVLDLFCYTGAFGLTALRHGAADRVLGVDVSARATDLAGQNAALNELADRCEYRTGRVFDVQDALIEAGERFGTVICDPPKMTRSRAAVPNAMKGYHRLNEAAVTLLEPGGTLVTCCCSGLIDREKFARVLSDVSARTGRAVQILEARGPSADHPVNPNCPETEYLKCFVCRVL